MLTESFKGEDNRLSQLAQNLLRFEKRYLIEARNALRGERLSADMDGRDKVLSIIRKICERERLDFPAEAFEVLVSNFTIVLAVDSDGQFAY
jgi:hypothetical protein